jgi:hypothetical protein
MTKLKGAFPGCNWCGGNGCLGCDEERRKAEERAMKPIFTADRNDPKDMEALARIAHADVLREAFGTGGGGMAEINRIAAIESLKQLLRKSRKPLDDAPEEAAVE